MSNTDMEGCKTSYKANKQNIVAVEMENAHILSDLDYPEDYTSSIMNKALKRATTTIVALLVKAGSKNMYRCTGVTINLGF